MVWPWNALNSCAMVLLSFSWEGRQRSTSLRCFSWVSFIIVDPQLWKRLVWKKTDLTITPLTHPPTSFWVDLGSLSLASTPNCSVPVFGRSPKHRKNAKQKKKKKTTRKLFAPGISGKKIVNLSPGWFWKNQYSTPQKRYPNHKNELVLWFLFRAQPAVSKTPPCFCWWPPEKYGFPSAESPVLLAQGLPLSWPTIHRIRQGWTYDGFLGSMEMTQKNSQRWTNSLSPILGEEFVNWKVYSLVFPSSSF